MLRHIKNITEVLEQRKNNVRYVPNNDTIFRIFYEIKPKEIKVVLIGQDPYFKLTSTGETEAQGMSFSVPSYHSINSSVKNMHKELASDENLGYEFFMPDHGNLIEWVKQGVMLLNTHLTTDLNKAGVHSKLGFWLQFTIPLLQKIISLDNKMVFVLLGKDAQSITKYLNGKGVIIDAPHPSGANVKSGFIGSKVFSRCNEELIKQGKTPIDWRISNRSSLP